MKIIYSTLSIVWLMQYSSATSNITEIDSQNDNHSRQNRIHSGAVCYCHCDHTGTLIPSQPIAGTGAGTNLFTGVYYQLGMLKYPVGWVTWTEKKTKKGSGHYVQLDLNPGRQGLYSPGGPWYQDVQWMFQPSAIEGYYVMMNRGKPGMVATWSESETVAGGYHVTLQRITDSHADKHSLWKLVQPDVDVTPTRRGTYQLIPYLVLESRVTFTHQKHGDFARFIFIDKVDSLQYQPGQIRFDDTLFTFEPTQ